MWLGEDTNVEFGVGGLRASTYEFGGYTGVWSLGLQHVTWGGT